MILQLVEVCLLHRQLFEKPNFCPRASTYMIGHPNNFLPERRLHSAITISVDTSLLHNTHLFNAIKSKHTFLLTQMTIGTDINHTSTDNKIDRIDTPRTSLQIRRHV